MKRICHDNTGCPVIPSKASGYLEWGASHWSGDWLTSPSMRSSGRTAHHSMPFSSVRRNSAALMLSLCGGKHLSALLLAGAKSLGNEEWKEPSQKNEQAKHQLDGCSWGQSISHSLPIAPRLIPSQKLQKSMSESAKNRIAWPRRVDSIHRSARCPQVLRIFTSWAKRRPHATFAG